MSTQCFSHRPLDGPILGITNRLTMLNGKSIPQLGFGTYRMDPNQVEDALTHAIKCGFRHIDCAKIYSNEKEVGLTLQKCFASGLVKREDLFVTSKLWLTDQHPDYVESACRKTLKDLQLDYLDLYLIHWPVCWRHSPENEKEDLRPTDVDGLPAVDDTVKLSDTWKCMSALVDKGLVHSIGVSNCNQMQIQEVMADKTLHAPVVNQIEIHPANNDHDLLHFHRTNGILSAAYCALGMPTAFTPPDFKPLPEREIIKDLAKRCGFSPQLLLLNWNLDQGNVVIVKAIKKEHIEANAKAARFALDDPTRLVLNGFQETVDRFRVGNPILTKSGKPFFS